MSDESSKFKGYSAETGSPKKRQRTGKMTSASPETDLDLSKRMATGLVLGGSTAKVDAWEYLCVCYVMQLKHPSAERLTAAFGHVSAFKRLLPDSHMCSLTTVDSDAQFSTDGLDGLIVERISQGFSERMCIFKYLMQCYERVLGLLTRIDDVWDLTVAAEKQRELGSACLSPLTMFAGISLTSADLLDDSDHFKSRQEFWHLLVSSPKGRSFPKGAFKAVVDAMDEDTLSDFAKFVCTALTAVKGDTLQWQASVNALAKVSTASSLMLALMKDAQWLAADSVDVSLRDMQSLMLRRAALRRPVGAPPMGLTLNESMLGLLLRFDSHTYGFSAQLFQGISAKQKDALAMQKAFAMFAQMIHPIQDGLATACRSMIRNAEVRRNLVRYLEEVVVLNADRGKMRYRPEEVVSDGFMLNVNYVLLQLCAPIVKKGDKLLSKIDARYFIKNGRVWGNVTLVSGLSADERKSAEESLALETVEFKFTSEVFGLCLEALHIGFSTTQHAIEQSRQQIARLRSEFGSDPFRMAHLARIEDKLFGDMAHILDERFISELCSFYNFFCRWLLYLKDNGQLKEAPTAAVTSATAESTAAASVIESVTESASSSGAVVVDASESESLAPRRFRNLLEMIPEYFVEDLSRFFKLYAQLSPLHSKLALSKECVMKLILFLLGADTPLKNLYLQACLLEIVVAFVPLKRTRDILLSDPNVFERHRMAIYTHGSDDLNRIPEVSAHLVSVLVRLYKEVERTGSAGQYYEKFQFRDQISQIMKFLFLFEGHRNNLKQIWEGDSERVIGFVAMIINDLIHTLDAGLNGLAEIKELEDFRDAAQTEALSTGAVVADLSDDEANDFASKKQQVKFNLQMSCESLDLLTFLTTPAAIGTAPFLHELICPRMSVLISVYLDKLAGRQQLLKVKNIAEYNLRETFRFLLKTIVRIVVNLAPATEFRDALVADVLLFKADNFDKAIKFLRKHGLMTGAQIAELETVLIDLKKRANEVEDISKLLTDIPEEYCDPITYELMQEPVILTSRDPKAKPYVMERLTIERHLLNDPKNPFTREALTKDDLEPHFELQKEIAEWKAAKLSKAKTTADAESKTADS